jgi:hypothetical protein
MRACASGVDASQPTAAFAQHGDVMQQRDACSPLQAVFEKILIFPTRGRRRHHVLMPTAENIAMPAPGD